MLTRILPPEFRAKANAEGPCWGVTAKSGSPGSSDPGGYRESRRAQLRAMRYGYLWWTDDGPRGDAFLAWGYGGQFLYVLPDLDLVVVATTEWRGVSSDEGSDVVEAAVLDVIENHLVQAGR